ncbi:MAG: hypothetical protein U9Q21_03635, partial [Candidatus Auribacterota bacterium]|nr:hypothetical protein [Candidatus Auribacterota bacterium]
LLKLSPIFSKDNFRRKGLFWLVNTAFFKTLAALVFAWYLFGLISKKIKHKKISREEYSIPKELQYVRKKYYHLEKKLSRKGIIREPGQTLSEFLLKIKESNIDPEKKQDFIWFIEFYMFERYNT